jgi:hypothetical protein
MVHSVFYVGKTSTLFAPANEQTGNFKGLRLVFSAVALLLFGCSDGVDLAHVDSNGGVSATHTSEVHARLAANPGARPKNALVLAHQAALVANALAALPLPLSGEPARAQALALAHPPLAAQLYLGQQKLRAEVLSVARWRESDLTPELSACQKNSCYRVEIYDFARNTTLLGTVDLTAASVLSWRADAGRQGDIPERLKNMAISLAIAAPEVAEALGGVTPVFSEAQMASTKSALNGTRCERSKHLCVAPTFVQGNVAIWAIVDLTDYQLVGVQWTDVGNRSQPEPGIARPSEQSLSDAAIMSRYCERVTALQKLGWSLGYMLTASDGLRISEVSFQGKPMLESVKLVDWHVSYSERAGFGYSDAVGCPSFSSAAVLPFSAPSVSDLVENGQVTGFKLEQEFRSLGWPAACNYSYRQSYEFYRDGRFRPTAGSIGAGCGNDGTYRPVLRIAPAGGGWTLRSVKAAAFETVPSERYFAPDSPLDASGAQFQLQNATFALQIEPGRGQFAQGRGDHAWSYVTANAAGRDEGASDLLTLGPCCNSDFAQGPELFIDAIPEPLAGSLVFWYVPQLKNDTREGQEYCWARNQIRDGVIRVESFPCIAGPLFRPFQQSDSNHE